MTLLEQIRNKLVASGIVTTAWPCFIGFINDDLDQGIGLFDSGGLPADTLGRENVRPNFNIMVRAGRFEYRACFDKWKEVFDALQDATQTGTSPDDLDGIFLMQAMQTHPVMWVDEKQRNCASLNFRVIKAA